MEHSDGARYEGEWREDRNCGMGILTHSDGDRYEGGFQGNAVRGFDLHGRGAFRFAGGD